MIEACNAFLPKGRSCVRKHVLFTIYLQASLLRAVLVATLAFKSNFNSNTVQSMREKKQIVGNKY